VGEKSVRQYFNGSTCVNIFNSAVESRKIVFSKPRTQFLNAKSKVTQGRALKVNSEYKN
jgi:hypothetical protein